jgi:hypothetical protein
VLSVSILQLGAEQREERAAGGGSEPFCGTRELVNEWRRATSVDFNTRPLVESTRWGQYCFFLYSCICDECRRAMSADERFN